MDSPEAPDYIEFMLVDPTLIKEKGLDGAIVMTIGALYYGDSLNLAKVGTLRQRSQALDAKLGQMDHRVKQREQLYRQKRQHAGKALFYYCSRCGGRLEKTSCTHCGRRYPRASEMLGDKNMPTIPSKIVGYATEHKHRFPDMR